MLLSDICRDLISSLPDYLLLPGQVVPAVGGRQYLAGSTWQALPARSRGVPLITSALFSLTRSPVHTPSPDVRVDADGESVSILK